MSGQAVRQFWRVRDGIARRLHNQIRRRVDASRPTYERQSPPGEISRYLALPPASQLEQVRPVVAALSRHYLDHRFDLLGSGWTVVRHGMRCRGLDGIRYDASVRRGAAAPTLNSAEQERLRALLDPGYVPIDWHLDFKSGYRWAERCWYGDIEHGHLRGVDIKVPWELARMQHLPALAWAFALAGRAPEGFERPERYALEFRNQLLDFVSSNPPRFGVNWACTMDVAIRVANWLVAYDLCRAAGATFDDDFQRVLLRAVYEHARHITRNLEWNRGRRANHYLADVVGLLFAAAYLPRTPEIDAWLAFAIQALVEEVRHQFNEDGSNFESSTCYHRLSAEMVLYSTALVLSLPAERLEAARTISSDAVRFQPPLRPAPRPLYDIGDGRRSLLPPGLFARLERMGEFASWVTKPNGRVAQVGDNDSGRFLKLEPAVETMTVEEARRRFANLAGYDELPDQDPYWLEDHLDHRHLLSGLAGLFGREDFERRAGGAGVDAAVIRGLTRGWCPPSTGAAGGREGDVGDERPAPEHSPATVLARSSSSLLKGLERRAFPDFGLYVFRSAALYLAIRCGPYGRAGVTGHAHLDQLAVELWIDGEDVLTDAGSYVYTPLPDRRNEFRSVRIHHAPQVDGREPGVLDEGLFVLPDRCRARCLAFRATHFVGEHYGFGFPVRRSVWILEHEVLVRDEVRRRSRPWEPLPAVSRSRSGHSSGYGMLTGGW